MKIALACDHGAFAFKRALQEHLEAAGHQWVDCGTDSTESCDYPDYGLKATEMVLKGECDRTILSCTNGIGMCMMANKVPGIRAAMVYNVGTAQTTRKHPEKTFF